MYTSADELTVTVKTVGAAFDVNMLPNTDLTQVIETIELWDGVS